MASSCLNVSIFFKALKERNSLLKYSCLFNTEVSIGAVFVLQEYLEEIIWRIAEFKKKKMLF